MRRLAGSWQEIIIPALSVLAVLLVAESATAKKPKAPLPRKILQAKTVYLDNRSGLAKVADKAYGELTEWGRFQIVQYPKDAELTFLFSTTATDGDYVTTGYTQYDPAGSATSTHITRAVTRNYTHLTVVDRADGATLWTDSRRGFVQIATRRLLKELRQRIEQQEASK